MNKLILEDTNYREQMEKIEPQLESAKREIWLERKPGKRIHCVCYTLPCMRKNSPGDSFALGTTVGNPADVVVISHGFTETAEKYKEIAWYFLKNGYRVYIPEHCGHGYTYRLTGDLSLVHVDSWKRYVEDFLFVSGYISQENPGVSIYLYGHSMGGGIGLAVAARNPGLFHKLVLSSPMIRPQTGKIPWIVTRMIAAMACAFGKGEAYVPGHHSYEGPEKWEESCSVSEARFLYYRDKKDATPEYQLCAASYGWLHAAAGLNRYLQRDAYKMIECPVLLFQAEQDQTVSSKEQARFIRKLNRTGKQKYARMRKGVGEWNQQRWNTGRLVHVPNAKHEIFNSSKKTVEGYWKKIFEFLGND